MIIRKAHYKTGGEFSRMFVLGFVQVFVGLVHILSVGMLTSDLIYVAVTSEWWIKGMEE